MKLDTVGGSHFSHPDGDMIPPPCLGDDSVGIGIVIDEQRRRERTEIGQRIGLDLPGPWGEGPPPSPRRDDDSSDGRGYSFDM